MLSSTLSVRLTSTVRWSSSPLPPNHTLAARPARVAGSLSRPSWPRLKTGCARLIGARLGESNGVATKLAGAGEAMYIVLEPAELLIRAELVVEAASWFPGRPDQLAIALGQEPEPAGQLPDWLVNLVLDLGRAGLGAEAVMVGDALVRLIPTAGLGTTEMSWSHWPRRASSRRLGPGSRRA
jgi:hypothetical protein